MTALNTREADVRIRRAAWRDLSEILILARAFFDEIALDGFTFEENSVVEYLAPLIRGGERHYFALAVADGQIVGAISGHIHRYWFSPEKVLFDDFFYVSPNRRGGLVAYRLWESMRDWGAAQGVAALSHGVLTGINPDNATRFFTGMGMTFCGGIFRLPLSPPTTALVPKNIAAA